MYEIVVGFFLFYFFKKRFLGLVVKIILVKEENQIKSEKEENPKSIFFWPVVQFIHIILLLRAAQF